MTESYVRHWFTGDGVAEVRRGEVVRQRQVLGVPRYYLKELFVNALKYGLTRYFAPASVWLPAEIAMARSWGVISECRRTLKACLRVFEDAHATWKSSPAPDRGPRLAARAHPAAAAALAGLPRVGGLDPLALAVAVEKAMAKVAFVAHFPWRWHWR